MSCLLCSEAETSQHICFDCVVVVRTWGLISEVVEGGRKTISSLLVFAGLVTKSTQ